MESSQTIEVPPRVCVGCKFCTHESAQEWPCNGLDEIARCWDMTLQCHACMAWHCPTVRHIWRVDGFGHWQCTDWTMMDEAIEKMKSEFKPKPEHWYFITWTHNDSHTIDDVWVNICKFTARDLGFIECDYVQEKGENDRLHYHMRVKLSKPLKKQKLNHYTKVGHIDLVSIKKHTQENWENLEGYMSKENEICKIY